MSRIGGKFLTTHKEIWTSGVSTVVNHGFNTLDVLVVARDIDSGEIITLPTGWGNYDVGVVVTDANNVTLTGASAPAGSGIAITVLPL